MHNTAKMLAHLPPQQQLFVNCQQIAPSTAAFESSRAPAGFLQFTPVMISPNSSGRFDRGYDSDASGSYPGSSPPGSASSAPPAIYQQPSPYQPQHYQLQYSPPQYSPLQYPPQYQLQYSPVLQHPPQFQQAAYPATPAVMPQQPQQPQLDLAAWRDKFLTAFSSFSSGSWHLQIVSEPPDLHNSGVARNVWRYRQDQSADVQFVCRTCGNSSKATGHAVFWIYKNDATNTGQIWLKLYTRRCGSASGGCGQGVAEPVWRPAEAARALDSLRDHVAEAYYGAADSAIGHRQRRQSKQKLLHTTANAVEQ
ncbi:hypothetical protein BOX15_Mlig011587g1 [Macrostomum lignano]|uniref:Uncharacterized protein n=1 Tax=Macrostomum lignano TaxID=282301 RepID=A0A267DX70_9PLAT|nr:hypothetical protein BOX15_Mlig011587g1 [Macrostomum lignano]